jgi:diguanylate cyclase (GGDEF)-like protein/PAS domain S-box-containing protein
MSICRNCAVYWPSSQISDAMNLRWKLILGSALIEAVMLTVLVLNNVRLIETSLQDQVELRLREISVLLNASIAPSMAQLDYAPINGVFSESMRKEGIVYFALFDKGGKQVAGDGWAADKALPLTQLQIDIKSELRRFDTEIPIGIGSQSYGRLQFGISTEFLHQARQKLVRQSMLIATAEIVLSTLLLIVLGIWLTRHLHKLEGASLAVAQGNFDVAVEVDCADEVARVGQAFNKMTQEIKHRLSDLSSSEERFRGLTALSSDWYWEQDANFRFTRFQGGARGEPGQMDSLFLGKTLWECGNPLVAEEVWAQHKAVLEARLSFRDFEYGYLAENGESLFTSTSGEPCFDRQGVFTGYRGVGKNITNRKRTEAALVRSERLLRLSSQAAQIGSYAIDLTSGRWESSPLLDELLGIDESFERDIAGWQSLLHPDDKMRVAADFETTINTGKAFSREYRIIRPLNGETRWMVAWGDYELDSTGKPVLQVGAMQDISERKSAAGEIEHLAFYDPLTGLPNRRLLIDRLRQATAASTRCARHGALLFLDLDNFKTLNDTLGHDIGDMLLQQVAERLATCVREGDTVARLGGDEFVIMLKDLSENLQEAATQTEVVGEKILTTLNRPYQLANINHHSTPSIGVTLFMNHQGTIDDLMKRADLAMYQAKGAGRNTLRFFDPEMQATVTTRAALEVDLREALLKEQFVLYYQAQVDGAGRLTGVEALLRWPHPRRGMVSPLEFIPLAEETGVILPLGHWVLQTACAQLVVWAKQPAMAHLTIAVNVSARQFGQPNFVEEVLAILAHHGADPFRLKLELTESLLVNDVESIIAKMTALKAKGVGFSLDDFGTGYSSLSYLKRLPLDQLKIDQGFIRNILTDTNDAAIAKMVVALADSLGLAVIAEGVELKEQSEFLARQGCNAYQGYLFGRPLPITEFEALLQKT